MPTGWRCKRLNIQLLLEEKHNILKNKLLGNVERKRVLELEIIKQCEQLKKVEISMEKNSNECGQGKIDSRLKDG